jgi:ParB family transcriptional regulator, chromosome partitioning protein
MSDAGDRPSSKKRPSGLGRGLSALLGEIEREAPVAVGNQQGTTAPTVADGIRMVEISDLSPHPGQPRRHFDEGALDELARSITTRGLLQPIVVRPHLGHFQIVAGERRWRAAQRANLHQVPVIIKEFTESEALEIALIENIQREQLNAIEEGEAYARLLADFGHSQAKLGELVQKSRSHVANLMRLTELPPGVKTLISSGDLSMGHARALLTATDPYALARQVVERGLSVRETEKLAKDNKPGAAKARASRADDTRDADLAALERQLGDMLGLKVRIQHGGRGGTVTLGYSSLDQLDLICQRLSGEAI